MNIQEKKVPIEKLKNSCKTDLFNFKTTKDFKSEDKIIKQKRAEKALDFGLSMKSDNFNIFISGPSGIGRNTTALRKIKEIAKNEPRPDDICYVFNFKKPDEPRVLTLPAGIGCKFKDDIENFVNEVESEIKKAFESKEYEAHKENTVKKFEEQKDVLTKELEEFAKSKGFILQQSLTGIMVVPLYKGRPIKEKEYQKLSDKEKENLQENKKEVQDKIKESFSKIKKSEKSAKDRIKKLDKDIVSYAIGHLIEELKERYHDFSKIKKHLDEIKEDIAKNVDMLKKEEKKQLPFLQAGVGGGAQKKKILKKYKVNLLIDNCEQEGAPVIVENNPTYYNLVGKIEYIQQMGMMTTDFTMIKPGAIHKANGGYLIIQAIDILKDYFAWEALKRILKNKTIKIEDINERFRLISVKSLKPEPLDINLKVAIVGLPLIYHLLYIYDNDFKKLFKVKVDFDTQLERNKQRINQYVNFISSKCEEENLNHFNSEAVAKLVEHSSRMSSHKKKMSAKLSKFLDIIRESSYWASKESKQVVEAHHVDRAINQKIFRSNMVEEKIQQLIDEGTLLIDTEGEKTGQINGISVLNLGDYMFGKPSRITARTYLGKGDFINIEREAKMSGNIHSKGVLILKGYLGEKFAQDKPLALSASICFEQLYEEVEGDSASSTELYCILSSLSEIPLNQNIAVTGSVNQKGEVQPVGAINEKIEGYFKVCKIKGLNNKQGVMIPEKNVKHLMLREEIIKAVQKGEFNIYAVNTVEEGIEILTGIEAGEADKKGEFPEHTFFYKVNEKLRRYSEIAAKKYSQNK